MPPTSDPASLDWSANTLAMILLFAGFMHFHKPEPFLRIMPDWLPRHRELVAVSGFFELLIGLGLLYGPTRVAAAWGAIALFVAVFPANLHMAQKGIRFGSAPRWLSWARLPLQGALIYWAWTLTR